MGLDIGNRQFTLTAKLLRFEERFAILEHEDSREFRWPIKQLPDDLKVGDIVTLHADSPKTEKEDQYERMRKLLEDLIN